ncbi:MAG: biopolymer transporter ExbD [Candidatus Hydrogenedentes bacterium]|nr:biopolymer transporter ExbD [Candidatus Hydrogenedentota bacterium]
MKFRRNNKLKVAARLDMTPLVDVVLLLLAFFMLSSTFTVRTSIPIDVPQAEGPAQFEQKDLSITLSFDPGGPDGLGKIYVDEAEIVDWAELVRRLTDLHGANPGAAVQIRSDGRVPVERFVKVMGYANAVGIQSYSIAAQQPESP